MLDFYGFVGVKHLIRNLNSTTQVVIKILYWFLTALIVLCTVLLFAGFISRANLFWRSVLFSAIAINYFPKVIFFLFVLFDDLVRGVHWVVDYFKSKSSDPALKIGEGITRSDFILRTGAAVASIPAALSVYGIVTGAHDYRIRRHKVVLPNLPKEFDGIKIAQLSDIHSGSFWNKRAVIGGVEMLNAEKPDVVFFTGDLVNDKAEEVKDYVPIFSKIKSDLGVYSSLGNHDYGDYAHWNSVQEKQANLNTLCKAHHEMGWDLLRNEHRIIKVGGETIDLIGVENWGAKGNFSRYGNLSKAMNYPSESTVKLLLSHDPSHWDAQVRDTDIDIMFAGHTHGMQFGVEVAGFQWSPVQYMYDQWAGLYEKGNHKLYVNRGFGYIGLPGRIGIPPEITIMELVRA